VSDRLFQQYCFGGFPWECLTVLHPRTARFKGDVTVAGTAKKVAPQKTTFRIMSTLIAQSNIKEMMKRVPEWETNKKAIERTFEFDDFNLAIDFVNAVAEIADEEEHHPDIDIRWNKVKLSLSTHSEGGLTELDFQVAEKIDTLEE
jgi:4a-hydroxytetrahydrobiopterin dehydratase